MANNTKHISPGLYTKIEDLSQATVRIGTTTLGLVGETLKGPAFEPIKISSKSDFFKIFGGQSPVKKGSNVRYELPYVANSFLDESNQLYVTRILGLGGYETLTPYVLTSTGDGGDNILAIIRSSKPVTVGASSTINNTTITVDSKNYVISFVNPSNSIDKIIGTTINENLYVESIFKYDNVFENDDVVTIDASTNSDKTAKFNVDYQTPVTPFIVSDINTNVSDMFRFISISDGNEANFQIKISFENINTNTREFDILVRDFNDTDKNPIVLEAFRRCSMNPSLSSYVGKRIGTQDGLYTLKSSYIVLEIVDTCPINALPSGFKSFDFINYSSTHEVQLFHKSSHASNMNPRDKRKNYLGWDFTITPKDLLKFHGSSALPKKSMKGCHIEDLDTDSGLTPIKINFQYPSGSDFIISNDSVNNFNTNKFSVPFMGGFDGFDIFQKTNFYNTPQNEDYKAFIEGVKTMMNPDETSINIFATPGINYYDNGLLIAEILDMVEEDRGDCVYIINSPDYDDVSKEGSEAFANDISNMLDGSGLDSFYGATYSSYVLHNDTQNGVNIWLPPTFEVLRDMAIVDKKQAPWFSVAGMKNGTLKSSTAKFKLTNDASDTLYKNRINPIRTFNNKPYVFGNKTLQVEDTALNRLNVVRCILQIQKLVSTVAFTLLFEPLDDTLESRFKSLIEPILDDVRKQRGLIDSQIIVESSPADRDELELNGYILIKPTNALEYINITYGVTNQGAVFSVN